MNGFIKDYALSVHANLNFLDQFFGFGIPGIASVTGQAAKLAQTVIQAHRRSGAGTNFYSTLIGQLFARCWFL